MHEVLELRERRFQFIRVENSCKSLRLCKTIWHTFHPAHSLLPDLLPDAGALFSPNPFFLAFPAYSTSGIASLKTPTEGRIAEVIEMFGGLCLHENV